MDNEEKNLNLLRKTLDNIDSKLLKLLNKRMQTVHQVGVVKAKSGGAIYRPEREKSIIERLEKESLEQNGSLNKSAIEALFLEIFAISRNLELPENVAYLGPQGSFTHQAAESRFGAMSLTSLLLLSKVFLEKLKMGKLNLGLYLLKIVVMEL